MNTCLFAFYTSPSAAKIGYRWVWADPAIPAELLERLYSSLTKPVSASDDPATMNGGLISLGDSWCAVFRWVDAGRDAAGRSGKLGLLAAVLPRNQLAGLDLLAVLTSDIFAHPPEDLPRSTSAPIPRFPAPPLSIKPVPGMKRELLGLHSYPELLATAAALPSGGFLLELQRDSRGELCRLTTRDGDQPPHHYSRQPFPTSTIKQRSPLTESLATEAVRPVISSRWILIACAALVAVVVMVSYSHARKSATSHVPSKIATIHLSMNDAKGVDLPIKAIQPASDGFLARGRKFLRKVTRSEHDDSEIPIALGQSQPDTRYATLTHKGEEYEVFITLNVEVKSMSKMISSPDNEQEISTDNTSGN